MRPDLIDLLKSHDTSGSQRGNIDWITVLDRCSQDRESIELLREVPSADRRWLLAETGRAVFRENLGNYADELRYNTRFVIESGQLPELGDQLEEHTAFLFASLSDSIDFAPRASAEAHLAKTRVELRGTEHLEPFRGERGIVLLSVFQSHFGYAAPLLELLGHLALVRKTQFAEMAGYQPPYLTGWDETVEVVAADAAGGMRLFQLLRGRGAVGLYGDFLYSDARATRGLLFSRDVPISRTLLRLIQRTRAVVIPCAVARLPPIEGDRVDVELFSPLPASLNPEEATEAGLAIQISLATELLIRRFPAPWRLWNTLMLRWKTGLELD